MNKAGLEKKKLYDLIQMIAFHSREYLIEIFRSCYELDSQKFWWL